MQVAPYSGDAAAVSRTVPAFRTAIFFTQFTSPKPLIPNGHRMVSKEEPARTRFRTRPDSAGQNGKHS
jgi:hypothetical protein